jgi:hypothetical protein
VREAIIPPPVAVSVVRLPEEDQIPGPRPCAEPRQSRGRGDRARSRRSPRASIRHASSPPRFGDRPAGRARYSHPAPCG